VLPARAIKSRDQIGSGKKIWTTPRKIFWLLCADNPKEKNFDYFIVFNSNNCGFSCSGAPRRALAQIIVNARGLDINSPRSAENHPQDI
jgi:hypothetical protein